MMALFYWAWFSFAPGSRERNTLLVALLSAPICVLLARVAALNLPFRLRPIHDPAVAFNPPYGISTSTLEGWSSFPSDHAVLYFGIATGIFAASRRFGFVAIIYAVVFISLPRIYVGYHFPTDILVGFLVGGILTYTSILLARDSKLVSGLQSWGNSHQGAFYAVLFLFSFQIANLFNESRQLVSLFSKAIGF
jgi:undecaprenyl-diphosphatase